MAGALALLCSCTVRDIIATSTSGGGSGGGGACDPGTTATSWAPSCPTSAPVSCAAGMWVAAGTPNPDDEPAPLAESTHFAVYAPSGVISATQAQAAVDELENVIWPVFFGSPMFFPEPYCRSSTKYKTSVLVRGSYGIEGGAWGGGYMGIFIGPTAIDDHWGLAFSLMAAAHTQTQGLECSGAAGGCEWIGYSHANFAVHQVPEFRAATDVYAHCSEYLFNAPHLYLGSARDEYCNWQFMEYLKDRYCFQAVNEIWTAPTPSDDPFTNIAAARGWTTSQLNDFLGEWAMHNVTWDYRNPAPPVANDTLDPGATLRAAYGLITDRSRPERRLRLTALEPLDSQYATNRRFSSPYFWAPQRWGYNVVRLHPDAGAASVTVTFRGVSQSGADADWRWGLVATDAALTTPRYSALQRGADGQLSFCVGAGESLWLVVMGTPSVQQHLAYAQAYDTVRRYPYTVQLENAWPDGFQGGAPDPCPSGLARHANGGGCAPAGLPSSVYVGPYATVEGGAVSGSARIEDHATVVSGTVSGGTVGALSIVAGSFSVGDSATVQTTFYPLGFFEDGQSVSGTAWLYGDVEYRNAGLNESSGAYTGLVDSSSQPQSISDVNAAPPYAWRP